jgi:YfiR/HmsC-like
MLPQKQTLASAGRRMTRRAALWALLALFGGLSSLPSARSAEEFPEYQLKAAFLYNFARFVTWPTNAPVDTNSPVTIGILGTDPFGSLLRDTVQGKTVNGRKIVVTQLARDERPTGCQILFISRSEKDRIPSILESVKGQSILTVSEVDQFAQVGGMINLIVVSQSVRFEINLQAIERVGLQVSSKLVGLGVRVKPTTEGEGR